ncbi:MAG: sigma 54-interacting transcriptional regulator, partial [Chloroflexota bacterium]
VITWNNSGVVEHVNSTASQMLGVRQTALRGKPLDYLISLPDYIHSAIEQQRELNDTEARVQIDNRLLQCVINTRLIYDGASEIIGGVLMIRPLSQLRSFVNRQTNSSPQITFDDFIYESSAMHTVVRQAQMAAKGSGPALLMGEAGGGKTILAQAIHNASPRSSKPFVIVSCGMIPAEYMREALLGCDPHRDRPGQPSKFELADGGTLLLDNIDQLTLEAQQIVSGVISSRRVHRLYAPRPISINVRVIAMTTKDLVPMIETGGFLAELYYLFNAFRIQVPALRERAADLVPMIYRILNRIGEPSQAFAVEPEALDLLVHYSWPGNVRELESVLERIAIHAEGKVIRVDDLPENIRYKQGFHPETRVPARATSLHEAEREAIIAAGWACGGVV